jgi:hypothetical protein
MGLQFFEHRSFATPPTFVGHCGLGQGLRVECENWINGGFLQLLLDHQDAIAPEHNDPIHELLDDLGEVPTIESLIGNILISLPGAESGNFHLLCFCTRF